MAFPTSWGGPRSNIPGGLGQMGGYMRGQESRGLQTPQASHRAITQGPESLPPVGGQPQPAAQRYSHGNYGNLLEPGESPVQPQQQAQPQQMPGWGQQANMSRFPYGGGMGGFSPFGMGGFSPYGGGMGNMGGFSPFGMGGGMGGFSSYGRGMGQMGGMGGFNPYGGIGSGMRNFNPWGGTHTLPNMNGGF